MLIPNHHAEILDAIFMPLNNSGISYLEKRHLFAADRKRLGPSIALLLDSYTFV
jgi:hypothetical protein